MILTEEHRIKVGKRNKDLFQKLDAYCYAAKNLSNTVNYIISQSQRISRKLRSGEILTSVEKALVYQLNCGIYQYNKCRPGKPALRYIDEGNGYIADAYFLSWYLKSRKIYKEMPYATCGQICIQEKCREWKSYHKALSEYKRNPDKFMGYPKQPGYLDPKSGRGWLVITSQNFSVSGDGSVRMPGFLKGIHIKARHGSARQIRILAKNKSIKIQLMYEAEEKKEKNQNGVMSIDLGVDNHMTAVTNTAAAPVIINGRPVKSMNQFYNKRKSILQETAKKSNRCDRTARMEKLTEKRNRKIKDYLHKASRRIVTLAEENGIGTIIIGNNRGWKQEVSMGKKTNQNFVSIPYSMLMNMITYKAEQAGIEVRIVRESWTSGTSYLDAETPDNRHYDKSRRISRGMFQSNEGKRINADVNAAYQIMKVAGVTTPTIKEKECVRRLNVA